MRNMPVMEANGLPGRLSGGRSEQLTPRQIEVLSLLCEGLSNKLIGRRLNISSATVKLHVASILRVLRVSSRLQAVIAARSLGLVDGALPAAPAREAVAIGQRALEVLRLLLGEDEATRLLAARSGPAMAAAHV